MTSTNDISLLRIRVASALRVCSVFAVIAAGCKDGPQQPAMPVDPCAERPCGTDAVVPFLAHAYQTRSYERFAVLLHDGFRFILPPDPHDPTQPIGWDRFQELRVHRRMFEQCVACPPEPPLYSPLVAVDIALAQTQPFAEAPEHYRSSANPGGLDPARWRAWGAEFATDVVFVTQDDWRYCVHGLALFVVAQDLARMPDEPGASLLYVWKDLGAKVTAPAGVTACEPANWATVKRLYE